MNSTKQRVRKASAIKLTLESTAEEIYASGVLTWCRTAEERWAEAQLQEALCKLQKQWWADKQAA